jgi:hypothetical protein
LVRHITLPEGRNQESTSASSSVSR